MTVKRIKKMNQKREYQTPQVESDLMHRNLNRIARMSRRMLLRFLDQESSKANTERLRCAARIIAIQDPGIQVDADLTRVELDLMEAEKGG